MSSFWFSYFSLAFKHTLHRTELQRCPTWAGCSFQNFPLMQGGNHIPVSCIKALFILSFNHSVGDRCLASVCIYVWNMWRAAPPVDGDIIYIYVCAADITAWWKEFLSFGNSHASRSFIPPTKCSQLLWCLRQSRWMTDVLREHYLSEAGHTVVVCGRRMRLCGSKLKQVQVSRKHPHPGNRLTWVTIKTRCPAGRVSLTNVRSVGPRGSAGGTGEGFGVIVV